MSSPLSSNAARTWSGHLAQLSSTTVWCVGIILQKTLTQPYSLSALVMVQMLVSGILLWMLVFMQSHGKITLSWSIAWPRFIWGFFTPGLVVPLSFFAATRLEGVVLSFFFAFMPILVPLLARLLIKERSHFSLYIGAGIVLGATTLEVFSRRVYQELDTLGVVAILAAVFLASLSQVVGRFLNLKQTGWEQSAALQLSGAAFMSVLIWLFSSTSFILPTTTLQDKWVCLYLIVFMTSFNFLFFNLALSRIPAGWVSFYSVLAPLIGTLAAWGILAEPLSGKDFVFMFIIMIALAIPYIFSGILRPKQLDLTSS